MDMENCTTVLLKLSYVDSLIVENPMALDFYTYGNPLKKSTQKNLILMMRLSH